MARAYAIARPGQVVELAAGVYSTPQPDITADPSKRDGRDVVFRPAAHARVTIEHEIVVYAHGIEFESMRFADGWTEDGSHLTFRNIDAAGIYIHGTDIRVIGGQVHPNGLVAGEWDPLIASGRRKVPPRNIVIDGVWFHGWLRPEGSDFHVECLQAGAGVNVVIRRSRFSNCATHDLFIRAWGEINNADNTLRQWVIENNFFGKTRDGYYSIQLLNDLDPSDASDVFVIRNNSWTEEIHVAVTEGTSVTISSNVGEQNQWGCDGGSAGVLWMHNVFTRARCSSTDLRADSGFVDPSRLNLRLKPHAAAINRGDRALYPAVDIFGNPRPRGVAPDAGAVETR